MKFKLNVVYIVLIVILLAVLMTLTVVYNLYGSLGTVTGIIINICIAAGLIGILEIDDWLIWYRRWSIKKYLNTDGVLKIKAYNEYLKKQYLEIPIKINEYIVNNNRVVLFKLNLKDSFHNMNTGYDEVKDLFVLIRINPITNGVTLYTMDGNKPYKLKYTDQGTIDGKTYIDNNALAEINMDKLVCTFIDNSGYKTSEWYKTIEATTDKTIYLTFNNDTMNYTKNK